MSWSLTAGGWSTLMGRHSGGYLTVKIELVDLEFTLRMMIRDPRSTSSYVPVKHWQTNNGVELWAGGLEALQGF